MANLPYYGLHTRTITTMSKPSKNIAVLGSTGSIGTQTLEVVAHQPEGFALTVLTAQRNVELLAKQARQFKPKFAVIGDEALLSKLRIELADTSIKVLAGADALADVVTDTAVDLVLTALVGFAGLRPTLAAIRAGKHIALANKETLVVAGKLIMPLAKEKGVHILPVDSEHSAIFQCLVGEPAGSIEKIYLTASGGPFRGFTRSALETVTLEQALKHPNWTMGSKITIDSASMMNKGLEVIEARWLFGLGAEQIDIVVHPQSIIHSIVQFTDGSMKAQLGTPDMRTPIQYALTYPTRMPNRFPRFDFTKVPNFSFEGVDRRVFRTIEYAYQALQQCGNMPCILNAANEVAVAAVLNRQMPFFRIFDVLETALARQPYIPQPTLDDLFATDQETRRALQPMVA